MSESVVYRLFICLLLLYFLLQLSIAIVNKYNKIIAVIFLYSGHVSSDLTTSIYLLNWCHLSVDTCTG